MTRAPALLLTVALLGLAGLAGCGGSDDDLPPAAPRPTSTATPTGTPTQTPTPTGPSYVALGDSYAAAPGVPRTSGEDGCFRSSGNYAHLLAAEVGLSLTDVTCSGATTATVLADQVPALGADTEVVTIGIGGNDEDLFASLLSTCARSGGTAASGSPCTDEFGARLDDTLPRIADNVAALLEQVTAAAPEARVVVVGYPDLLPETGTCPDLVPLAAGDYPVVARFTAGLSGALRDAAEAQGLDFVDVGAASRGHDICSADPWVNGAEVADDGTIPFHPFATEQAAVARLVADVLATG